jgi:hypothetical protein
VQAWSPYLKSDIKCLEQIQRRATKLVGCIKKKSYEERLQILNLLPLEKRRLRGDLIEMFKIMTGREGLNETDFFHRSISEHSTRGHSMKLFKERSRLDIRKYSFSQRAVDDWNSLPQSVMDSTSVNMFKNRLDKHWADESI